MNRLGLVLVAIVVGVTWAQNVEEEAKKFIDGVFVKREKLFQEVQLKQWAADTATDKVTAQKAAAEADATYKRYVALKKEDQSKLMSYHWKTFKDKTTERKFFLSSFLYENALPDTELDKLKKILKGIQTISDNAQVKEYKSSDSKPKLLKAGDVQEKITKDYKNADEINYYWKAWHDAAGKPLKDLYTQWVTVQHEVAKLDGYKDTASYWQSKFEIENFEKTMYDLYKQIEPLFKELHAYMRYKLWVIYGKNDKIVDPKGPIPSSLLGWMWGNDPSAKYDLFAAYPQKKELDIEDALQKKGFQGKKLAEVAGKYYESLGFSKLPDQFWKDSIFEKKGAMNCSTGFYDFFNGRDFRVFICATAGWYNFNRMHELFGYTEYAIAYKDQPYYFKLVNNDAFSVAFQVAIDDLTNSPLYWKSLGLLDSTFQVDKQLEINTLLKHALNHVFFLPFGLAYDTWQWRVTQGKVTPQNYNCEYWKMRTNLQGVAPPVDRDENDFDPGVTNSWFVVGEQYITWYISVIMQHDMLRGLCKAAGYYDPKTKPNNSLVFCDITNSKAAGAKLKEALAIGGSRPWPDVLEKITGSKKLDASGLLEFYNPLYLWLKEENKKNKVTTGWTTGNRCH